MNIHEYQAKEVLRNYNIDVPNGQIVFTLEEAKRAVWRIESDIAVIKAQIHSGGRGKAGGIKIAKSIDEVIDYTEELLGKKLVTHQTGPEGRVIKGLLIEEGCHIEKEYYIGFTLDRRTSRIAFIASEEGGTEIEQIAESSPEKILKEIIDPVIGLTSFQARRMALNIKIPKNLINKFITLVSSLYKCFVENDCILAEINPLVVTKEQKLLALDAKLNFDSNALYRQGEIAMYRDLDQEDEKEIEASKYNLSYVSLDGTIGCMVNGAGLAMATMDIIKYYGGEPANFLDVGGSATEEQVKAAFTIILSDKRVKGIFVNIFGGIMKCDVIARGIVKAAKEVKIELPLVVRLEGTNMLKGKEILNNSGLNIFTTDSIGDGARKIVQLAK
jgi:succinyl-CoA synthetase beta subunit